MLRGLRIAALVLGALLVAIQLVPYGRDHANPAVALDAPWPSAEARRLAVAACYDCHSNETDWPWYASVAPMSWLVQRDVDRGRAVLNFSEWDRDQDEDGDDMAEAVADGSMPPGNYLLLHAGARLSDGEKAALRAALDSLPEAGEAGEAGGEDEGDERGGDRRGPNRGPG